MTNNPTIDGVSRELLRKQFEEKNGHRGWFVAGGRSDDTGPEGFVYEDFTTDMCWTCYFEASAALQSTIAQLEDKLNKAIDLDFQRRETIYTLTKALTDIRENSDDIGACECAAEALNGERK